MGKTKAVNIDDQLIVDILNTGGTFEDVAERLDMSDRLKYIKQYCHDRGYTLKNRGNLVVCKSSRDFLSSYEKICPICGCHFSCSSPDEYVYKIKEYGRNKCKIIYFCSYTCYRKVSKNENKKPGRKRVNRRADPDVP